MASNGRNQLRHAHTLDGYSSRHTPDAYSSRHTPDPYSSKHTPDANSSRHTPDGYSNRHTLDSSRHTPGGYSNRHTLDSNRRQKPPQPEYWATLDPSAGLTYRSYGDYSEIVYMPPNMCYVIVTIRSLLWTFMTIIASVTVVGSIITPQWLVGEARLAGPRSENTSAASESDRSYHPTLGIFNLCTKVNVRGNGLVDHCPTFVTGFEQSTDEFPNLWKSSLIFFTIAVALLGFTNVTAVFSLCIQSIFRKSIFTVSGLLQAIAGGWWRRERERERE
jgi:hypothetical protein